VTHFTPQTIGLQSLGCKPDSASGRTVTVHGTAKCSRPTKYQNCSVFSPYRVPDI